MHFPSYRVPLRKPLGQQGLEVPLVFYVEPLNRLLQPEIRLGGPERFP